MRPHPGSWVFAGGCLGTSIRATLGHLFPDPNSAIPLTTLVINLTGAFALGWLLRTLALHGPDQGRLRVLRLGLGTGLLGGYTTFSAFDVQSLELARQHIGYAAAYLALTMCGGFIAAWTGTRLAVHTQRGTS